jgi:hypothetical protein
LVGDCHVRYLHVCVQVYVRDMMDEKCAVSQTIRESTVAPRTSSVVVRVVDDGDGGWRTCSLARADTTILLVVYLYQPFVFRQMSSRRADVMMNVAILSTSKEDDVSIVISNSSFSSRSSFHHHCMRNSQLWIPSSPSP